MSAGAAFVATVGIGSQREGTAVVELRSDGKVLARQPAAIAKGLTRVRDRRASVDAAGAHVLEAAVTVAGDPLAANNTLDREAWVAPRPKVLYVEGAPASARYLSGALTGSGFDVTVRPPSGLPATAAQLDPCDVVVLSDVARARPSERVDGGAGRLGGDGRRRAARGRRRGGVRRRRLSQDSRSSG